MSGWVRRLAGSPSVTVLLAVHNGGAHLEPALRSVMAQTLRDIEIVVVDDCSTDGTPEVLARLAAEDGRIRVERLAENLRLPRALNRGLDLARAPLIARMDADDLAEPERLATQAAYLDAHPSTVLVGTSVHQIDAQDAVIRTSLRPRDAFGVRWLARFHMPLVHPTFMFRAPMPGGEAVRYDPAWTVSEDYDLLVRMLAHGDVVNLPNVLLRYRVHEGSITGRTWALQQEQARAISLRHARAELPSDTVDALEPFREAFFEGKPVETAAIFAGLRRMAIADVRREPARRAWIRRQTAQLARHAMERSGRGSRDVVRAFLGPGRDFLLDMSLRAAEVKRLLPPMLRSDPVVV